MISHNGIVFEIDNTVAVKIGDRAPGGKIHSDRLAVSRDRYAPVGMNFHNGIGAVLKAGSFYHSFECIVVDPLNFAVPSCMVVSLEDGYDFAGVLQDSADVSGVIDIVRSGTVK